MPGSSTVAGLGGVTVRVDGRSTRFEPGAELSIEALGEAARGACGRANRPRRCSTRRSPGPIDAGPAGRRTGEPPLRDEMATLEGTFVDALDRGDVRDAVGSLLDLDTAIAARVRAGEDSPDLDNASATFRSLIVRLGERAGTGTGIPRETADELVRALLAVRETGPREPRLSDRGPHPRPPDRCRHRGPRRRGRVHLGARRRGLTARAQPRRSRGANVTTSATASTIPLTRSCA